MLYPFSTIAPAQAALAATIIPPGCLLVIPIDMTVLQVSQSKLRQVSQSEDFSLRAWVSVWPGGEAIGNFLAMAISSFAPTSLVVHIEGVPASGSPYMVEVAPGRYNLNILNLINQAAALAYTSIET